MPDFDERWALCMATRLRAGEPLTRDLVSSCFHASSDDPTDKELMDKWIDVYWRGAQTCAVADFTAIRWWRRKKLGALLHKILT